MKYLVFIILLSVLIQGCNKKSKQSDFPNAGVITYVIDYPKEITDTPTGSLMPKEFKFSFKNNRTRHSIKGSFSVFSLDFYSPSTKDSCATVFRFMDNNLLHTGSNSSNFFFFDGKAKPSIELHDNETKEIAGMTCSKATVSFEGSKPFQVYYSNSISLENPNRHSPFKEIPGVLMEFCVDFNGVRFHFTANKVDYSTPKNSIFKVPNSAKRTKEKEIEDLIITLIKNFQ